MKFISEPSLNSELILINNAKKLEKDSSLFNDQYLEEIERMRKEYEILDQSQGYQLEKRKLRNKIRDYSIQTYVYRDKNLFGEMILLMLDKLLTRPNFVNYNYKNEMKSLAIEHILKYTWKFDPYRKSEISGQYISAFTYITTIAFNAFVATINKHNKEKEKIKQDFLETQKLLHREPNRSKIEEEYSLPKKEVIFNNINKDLFSLIKMIILDEKDILVKIPENYHISLEEYEKIKNYSNLNKINISISRIFKNGKKDEK